MLEFIDQELAALKKAGLYRELRVVDRDKYKIFCSNDYLGLARHPKVKARAIAIIKEFGFGAGAARLISGNTAIHEELEKALAKFKRRAAAIVFPAGYMANLGAITSLVSEEDTVIIDRLNHASIIDACRLSKAKLQVFPHKDLQSLAKILQRSAKFRRRLIITDAVFSMDGDLAPLAEIVALGKEYDALTMADYAHATGVVDLPGEPDIIMGTLSKAVGSLGGFIAGSAELIAYLRNKARSFIYTTALPPAACGAALAALEIITTEPQWRRRLWENVRFFQEIVAATSSSRADLAKTPRSRDFRSPNNNGGLKTAATFESPIIPIIIGAASETMRLSAELFERGFFVSGIRPPTVPDGESRLRITVTADHTKEDIECLVSSLRELTPAAAKHM